MRFFICFFILSILSCETAFCQKRSPVRTTGKAIAPAMPAPLPVNPYAAIDSVALLLPDTLSRSIDGIKSYIGSHFENDSQRVRAAFVWVAYNINYDVTEMYAINYYQDDAAKNARTLETRRGICEHYAVLFRDICRSLNIKAYMVEGYNRRAGVMSFVPHGWCVVLVNNKWSLFDPTWAAGALINGEYKKRFNNRFYMVAGEDMIHTHMPFDYMWQLLSHPVTAEAFQVGQTSESGTPFFNYADSIAAFEGLDEAKRYEDIARRMEANGLKNAMSFSYMEYVRRKIQTIVYDRYNRAVDDYNKAGAAFNSYVDFYNNRFRPEKPDNEIQAMITTCSERLTAASEALDSIQRPEQSIAQQIVGLRKQITDLSMNVKKQQEWLNLYFSKGKGARRNMFIKFTWFGIPLN